MSYTLGYLLILDQRNLYYICRSMRKDGLELLGVNSTFPRITNKYGFEIIY